MAIARTTFLLVVCLAMATLVLAQNTRNDGQMDRRRQELKLELLRERARIIREDPDAMALKDRIEALQLDLARLVDSKPGIQRLQAELGAVEKVLQRQAENR